MNLITKLNLFFIKNSTFLWLIFVQSFIEIKINIIFINIIKINISINVLYAITYILYKDNDNNNILN